MMRSFTSVSVSTIVIILFASCISAQESEPKILVFSKTVEWYHESIPQANRALMELGKKNGIAVDTTTNASLFTRDNLNQYAAVVFLSTTGDVLDREQEKAFQEYIRAGGGFVGIHGASDTEHDWEWYGQLLGGYFKDHPENQEAILKVVDKDHSSTHHLPVEWKRYDEWYNFRNLNKNVKVLITIDETSYEGGAHGAWHPMAWYHEFEGGRSFYTALGHLDENYSEPLFLEHLLGGIRYAIGEHEN